MSKVNQQDIDKLIELVGGRGNIATVSHCITRLRFVLNDPAIARPKEIEQLRMVKGCFTNAGQFQVVIGTEVGDYYKALLATTGQTSADKEQVKQAARQNMKWHDLALRRDLLSPAAGPDQRRSDPRFPQRYRRPAHEQWPDAGPDVSIAENHL